MRRRPLLLVPVVLLVGGVALSAGANARGAAAVVTTEPPDAGAVVETTAAGPVASLPVFEPGPIEWTEIGPGVEEGWLEVPVDYADPEGPTFRLYLVRHLAGDPSARIGSLLVNPGGPGFGGSFLAEQAEFIYSPQLLDRFDIVGWDPRGTGRSEPAIDCIDDYDAQYAVGDITPDDDEERQQLVDLAEGFAADCEERSGDILLHVGTNDSARDIDTIRRALGEEQISWFGFSYGSELGGTWVTLFPDTVRAAVFDGASDANADALEQSLQQNAGFEATLATFLAQCSADPSCAFHSDGDAEGAFDGLMLKLDEKPIPTDEGRPQLTRGVAIVGVAQAMYNEASWPELAQALAAAQQGDGSGMLALFDAYFGRLPDGTWDNSLEAFQAITCVDTAERLTVEEEDATAPQFNEVAPRLAPATVGGYFCTFFPETPDPRVEITGDGAGPIVLCGATGDAATPLQSTRNMAESLEDGRLIIIEADQHTCWGADPCADAIIESYLVDLEVPDEVTEC